MYPIRSYKHHHGGGRFPFLPFLAGLAVSPFLFGGKGYYGYGPYYGPYYGPGPYYGGYPYGGYGYPYGGPGYGPYGY
ncbi:penicillin-binding protein [Bacillus timonensis]|nr:penicillin-binding protein [Bacillus timonensis]